MEIRRAAVIGAGVMGSGIAAHIANAGLPVGLAKPLGGWEQPENGQRSSELRGHFPGHFLSASAQLAANGDKDAKAKGDYIVAEMAKCQQKLGGNYLSAFPTTWWDRLEKGERVWAPFYTIHKIMAGMFDMYSLAGNQQALHVLEGMAAWADAWTAPKTAEHMQRPPGDPRLADCPRHGRANSGAKCG